MKNFLYMESRKGTLDQCKKELENFLKQRISKGFMLVRGPIGIGKSLFLRKLLLSMKNKTESMGNFKYSEKPSILISSLNPLTKQFKLNGARPIL